MNKLTLYQDLTIKADIKPLKQLPRLTYTITHDKQSRQYPSSIDLITLSSNLTYKAHLILTNQARVKKDKRIEEYMKQSIELHRVLNDYENSYIDMREYNRIKKEFGI